MPSSLVSDAPSLNRTVGVAAVAAMTLLTGGAIIMAITKNTPDPVGDDIMVEYRTSSGGLRVWFSTGGTITMSGGIVAHNGRSGSGKIAVAGSDGARLCVADNDGTGYTACWANNGVLTCYVAPASECP